LVVARTVVDEAQPENPSIAAVNNTPTINLPIFKLNPMLILRSVYSGG
jgi:hypothetical protein